MINNKLLLLFQEHTDALIEQIKTKPQESLEFNFTQSSRNFLIQSSNKPL